MEITKSQIMASQLKQYQSLSLKAKVTLSKKKIQQWLDHWDDQCYVAFSGGKDSTVLLDLVWSINPRIPAVFVDTGLEYPEIREFVKSYGDRVVWLKPKMPFNEVIEKYGYPVVSKKTADYVGRCQRTSNPNVLRRHLEGENSDGSPSPMSKIPNKWQPLIDAPFKVSDKCCDVMKKNPLKDYEKETGRVGIIGVMAGESDQRRKEYLRHGCNAFELKHPLGKPISFWTEQDILKYVRDNWLRICKVYGKKEGSWTVMQRMQEDGSFKTCGEDRTGCMFCMFGVHMEKGDNRFQRMKRTHPKQWKYCINKLGCGKVLDFIGVKYVPDECCESIKCRNTERSK